MKYNTQLVQLIAKQMNQEITNSTTYLALANRCQYLGYVGTAKYFKKQSAQELTHFEKFNSIMQDLKLFDEINPNPPGLNLVRNSSLLSMLVQYKDLEDKTTEDIHSMLVMAQGDVIGCGRFIQLLLDMEVEQVEESASVDIIFDKATILGISSGVVKPGIELSTLDDFIGNL